MRILHVTDTYLPTVGGIELHVRDLATRQAFSHDVAVLTPAGAARSSDIDGDDSDDGPAVLRVPGGLPFLPPRKAVRAVEELDPDVVHAHVSVVSPFTWSVARAAAGRPVLATMHSMGPPSDLGARAVHRIVGTHHGHVTWSAVGRVAAERVARGLPPEDEVHVLHNGIDVGAWHVERQAHETFTFTSVGRLAPRKRPHALVRALARVAHVAPDLPWRLLLVGDGPERDALRRAVTAYGLDDRVVLTGPLGRDQIREVLRSADVFVAPARLESFGIAALEARCAGLPVVAMSGSGVGDFVEHEVDGLLASDDADLSRALGRLVTRPDEARRLGLASQLRPPPMDWSDVLARHEVLYARASERVHGARPDTTSPAPETVVRSRA